MSVRYHQALLVSCVTPWDEREELIEPLFRKEIQHLRALGFTDLYIFGTACEGYAVDSVRFERIVEVFAEETLHLQAASLSWPQVGVIGLSTCAVKERLRIAYNYGFRVFQLSLPCWGVLNDAETTNFFQDVCGSFADCQFLHYNLMRTKRLLAGKDYRRLADLIPNLVATKNTSSDVGLAAGLMRHAPDLQHFLGETTFPTGCLYGECSLLSSFGPMLPTRTRGFFECGRKRDFGRLFELQREYLLMINEVLSPMLEHPRIDGAYDKALARLGGLEMPLRLLSPYEALPEEAFQSAAAILKERYANWLG